MKAFGEFIIQKFSGALIREPTKESADAFKVEYRHQEKALTHFRNFVLKNIIEEYISAIFRYHSLCFSIVQSSGFGKSRLVLEAGKAHLNVVYCCLRSPQSNGYPLCNRNVYQFIQQHNSVEDLKLFIICTYTMACSEGSTSNVPPMFLRENEGDENEKFENFWDEVIELVNRCRTDELAMARVISKFVRGQSAAVTDYREESFCVSLKYQIKSEKGKTVQVEGNFLTHLVIVFDEARTLLDENCNKTVSTLRNFQKAQQELKSKTCVLAFIDTLLTISQYKPLISLDPSLRPVDQRSELLPAFYEILTADPGPSSIIYDQNTTKEEELAQMFSFGRPIWHAYYFASPDKYNYEQIQAAIHFARQKLSYVFKAGDFVSNDSATACMASHFGILGIMDHTEASTLMSSFMGTCVYVGPDHLRLVVLYAAEPIVAEAACHILHGTFEKGLKWNFDPRLSRFADYLEVFSSKIITGLVDIGDLGELLARVILSLSYDYAHLNGRSLGVKDFFSDSIRLRAFLNYLIPDSYQVAWKNHFGVELIIIPKEDLDGYHVAFTSWIPLYKSAPQAFNQEHLRSYYQRRCAIILPLNHKGSDLVIPMKHSRTGIFSFITIQVRNKHQFDVSRFDAAGKFLDPTDYFGESSFNADYIGIYMEVDRKDPAKGFAFQQLDKETLVNFQKSYPRHQLLIDVAQEFLTGKLVETFQLFQQSSIDIIGGKDRAHNLKSMAKLSFDFCSSCNCAKNHYQNNLCACFERNETCTELCHGGRECQNLDATW